jgi:hypothetical protein
MEVAERWLKHQYRVYGLGRRSVAGDLSKRAGAHCHTHSLGLEIEG